MLQAQSENPSKISAASNPVQALYDLLAEDMKAVNATILEQMQSDVPMIPQIAEYLIAAGGKRIRPLLTLASAKLCGYQGDKHIKLAAAVEFIHTATLLHDDVVDDSEQRRGKPSANIEFGNQASVLVGDFLFSRAFELMVETENLDVLHVLSSASCRIAEGEVMQLSKLGDLEITLDDYLEVIKRKTAALFEAACEAGAVLAKTDDTVRQAMKEYGCALGVTFQITDDILDYSGDATEIGKNLGDDFFEGKVTLPALFCYEQGDQTEKEFWQNNFEQKTADKKEFENALNYIAQKNILEQCYNLSEGYAQKSINSIQSASNQESDLKTNLANLANFVQARKK